MATRDPARRSPDDRITEAERAALVRYREPLRKLAREAAHLADEIDHVWTVVEVAEWGERLAAIGDILREGT